MFADFFGNHDGTVLSTGATEGDSQIALAFVDVVRQQINEKIGNARDEFPGLRERANVLGEAGIGPRKRPEFGHKVWVRQEAHVKNQVGVLGDTLTESETYA